MLATHELPERFARFNAVNHAPFGTPAAKFVRRFGDRSNLALRVAGAYGWQTNNTTRAFEYPWVAEQINRLGTGLRIADVGASLAGMQYTLARQGHDVLAVDPGMKASGRGWQVDPEMHRRLGKVFNAPVTLIPATLPSADLAESSLDVVLSVSTIEHFSEDDLEAFCRTSRQLLRGGGHLVLTVDLFLDLAPFTSKATNVYGTNVDVRRLLEMAGAELRVGDPSQLYGFPEFEADSVQASLSSYLVGSGYPAMAQCLVAQVIE